MQGIVQKLTNGREYTMRVQFTDEAIVVGAAHEVEPVRTCELIADAILDYGITGAIPENIVGCGHAVLRVLREQVPEAYVDTYGQLCSIVNEA